MTSNWALPTSIIQYAETSAEDIHVSWVNVDDFYSLKNLDGRYVRTSRDLVHIAKQPRHDYVEKTYYLRATGFNFYNLPESVSGIEMKLSMNRYGRITDETIQLCLNEKLMGDNKATRNLDLEKKFGGETDTWEAGLSIADIDNSTFGVLIRFQSHPDWPHKCSALVDAIQLRVH